MSSSSLAQAGLLEPSDPFKKAVTSSELPNLLDKKVSYPAVSSPLKKYQIAVVQDGPIPQIDTLLEPIEKELQALTQGEANFEIKKSPEWIGAWSLSSSRESLERALQDEEIDILLATGPLTTHQASDPSLILHKPVVSTLLEKTTFSQSPLTQEGTSSKKNFTFILQPRGLAKDLKIFQEMVGFPHVHLLIDEALLSSFPEAEAWRKKYSETMGFPIHFLPAGTTPEAIMKAIRSAQPQALYLTSLLRLSPSDYKQVIDGINHLRLPSFAMNGKSEVEAGALAALFPKSDDVLVRRIALNLYQLFQGMETSTIPVYLNLPEQLIINGRTAQQIGYHPSFAILATAHILLKDTLPLGPILTLKETMQKAVAFNADIAIQKGIVQSSEAFKNLVRSTLLPQIYSNVNWTGVDLDRSLLSQGMVPPSLLTTGIAIRQLIFSDQQISAYLAEIDRYHSSQWEQRSIELDIMALAATRFFDLLSSQALLRIELENLRVTQSNLELARLRVETGEANLTEILRWQSQEASNQATVNLRRAEVGRARVALNQTLGQPGSFLWQPQEVTLKEGETYFLNNALLSLLHNEQDLKQLEGYAVLTAFRQSPSLQALDQLIAAQKITWKESKRRFFLPEISGGFDYNQQLAADTTPGFDKSKTLNQNEWQAFVQASFPLFEGGAKWNKVHLQKAELDVVLERRVQASQLIDQRTRTSLYNLQAFFSNIRLSRRASKSASENLRLVAEQYREGAVNIIDLIDAQRQALIEDQRAALSVYDYLKSLIEFQRALSWFEFQQTPQQKQDWLQGLCLSLTQGEAFQKKVNKVSLAQETSPSSQESEK